MPVIQTILEPELAQRIETMAKENDRSLSAMARILLKTALKGEKNGSQKCV
jgi:hypothetical protein